MNFIDTSKNGGHPLYLEDIEFVQQSYKEAIAGITSSLGADSYILQDVIKHCNQQVYGLYLRGLWCWIKRFSMFQITRFHF